MYARELIYCMAKYEHAAPDHGTQPEGSLHKEAEDNAHRCLLETSAG